jgi:hypothetical protein
MAEARRAILKVMWHQELGPKMEQAGCRVKAMLSFIVVSIASLASIVKAIANFNDPRRAIPVGRQSRLPVARLPGPTSLA